jgi:hypothetical protein
LSIWTEHNQSTNDQYLSYGNSRTRAGRRIVGGVGNYLEILSDRYITLCYNLSFTERIAILDGKVSI